MSGINICYIYLFYTRHQLTKLDINITKLATNSQWIHVSGGITLVSLAALNYEDTSSYTLKVKVSDGTLYDVNYLYINITDVNEAPVIWNLAHEMDVNETETGLLFAVNATDPDGDVLTYTVRVIRPPATGPATFTVDLTGNSRTAMAASMKGRSDFTLDEPKMYLAAFFLKKLLLKLCVCILFSISNIWKNN